MNTVPFILLAISLPLLLGGCGEKSSSEGSESASEKPTAPSEEVKAVEEIQQEVKPEEPVAETKPTEAVSVSPHLKYETEGDAVTITGCDKKASGALIIPATIEGTLPDAGDALRDRDAGQAAAACEGSTPDAGDTFRNRDARQPAA